MAQQSDPNTIIQNLQRDVSELKTKSEKTDMLTTVMVEEIKRLRSRAQAVDRRRAED